MTWVSRCSWDLSRSRAVAPCGTTIIVRHDLPDTTLSFVLLNNRVQLLAPGTIALRRSPQHRDLWYGASTGARPF